MRRPSEFATELTGVRETPTYPRVKLLTKGGPRRRPREVRPRIQTLVKARARLRRPMTIFVES